MYGDALASWLVLLSPEQEVQVQAVAGDKVLCSWARHLRTFAAKISHVQIFLKLWLQVENDKIRLKM